MKKNSILTPIIVLVSIALVASFLLAAVNKLTSPIIEAREKETISKSLKLVLPDGDSFDEMNVELVTGVTKVYKAINDAGYVMQTNCKSSQGGTIVMMIGVNFKGELVKFSVVSHGETVGISDVALSDEYFNKFAGIKSLDDASGVDVCSGATKTSTCIKESAKAALSQFAICNPLAEH